MFKIGSVFIPVTDLVKASKWYEEKLGVKQIEAWEEGAGFYFPSGSTQLALIQVDEPQPTEFIQKEEKRNVYFNFLADDIDQAYQSLKNNGVKVTEINNFGGMKYFDFFDLDGNLFSVVDEPLDSPFHTANVVQLQKLSNQ